MAIAELKEIVEFVAGETTENGLSLSAPHRYNLVSMAKAEKLAGKILSGNPTIILLSKIFVMFSRALDSSCVREEEVTGFITRRELSRSSTCNLAMEKRSRIK